MNWRAMLPLAVFGPIMGVLMIRGTFPNGTDRFAWFVIVAACAFVIARREPRRALLHAGLVGFWNGASATMIQALFVDRLVANNPWMMERLANQPRGFDMEFFVFMLVPFIGVTGGAITGLLAKLFVRILEKR